ncbi:MAG: [FeFe] hydrogenase H-cluster radical SAM maturase HydE [Bacteroidales bacterium]|nr:[FeFe] hydrogenase H-cluster radical SAM maturase HydE [Bacteroidales bacterium]
MKNKVSNILKHGKLGLEEIVTLLRSDGAERTELFSESARIRRKYVGNRVYFRGLIEFSNICDKNCYYCGIRRDNKEVERYSLSDKEILDAALYAFENKYGSVVLQSGELSNSRFASRITRLLKEIKKLSGGKLGITLSVGEQTEEVYREWFEAGAHRYLLRIEASNPGLYAKLHPDDNLHSYQRRLECLYLLQKIGYQTGTGVMIGLPFQTYEDLAGDLLFMKNLDIDMVGMGPYIEHANTPMIDYKSELLPIKARFELSLNMIAVLRILMKDINIAASTALQAIDPIGREKAVKIGANVIMPNITPGIYRDNYNLYENKPLSTDEDDDSKECLEARLKMVDVEPGFGEWGDSKHYFERRKPRGSVRKTLRS